MCSSQPVVPTSSGTPSAAMPSTLPGTAAGMENSMATSTPAKFPAVRPASPGLLNSSSLRAASKSYSGASGSMSLPIFPEPTMASLCMHRLFAFEDFGVERGEELLVQRRDRAHEIAFGHHEADVEQRRSLADHADVDAIERIENPARHARRVPDVLAHQADDDAIVLHRGFGKLAQVAQDELDVAGVVDGQRDADFAGGHHIDGGFVAVENLEDAVQEAVGHQHARGVNVDRSDLALTGDRFYGVFAMHRFGGY